MTATEQVTDPALLAELRRAEEARDAHEARFHALFTSVDEGCCICEVIVDDEGTPVDYRFLEVNGLFESMTGLHDAVGRRAYELLPDLEPIWLERYAEVGIGRTPLRFQEGSDVMGRWFDVFAMPVEPDRHFLLLFSDISDSRRAEEALRESEERFRNMADSSPVMIWVTDADGGCTYLNESWYAFTGQPHDGDLGIARLDAVHPDDRPGCERAFREAGERREPFRFEHRLRRRDGVHRWVIDTAAPRLGAGGELLGYIGSVLDITERKLAEEALRAREQEERVGRLRAELLATVMSELEAVQGVRARASRLVQLLVPAVADVASLALPGIPTLRAPLGPEHDAQVDGRPLGDDDALGCEDGGSVVVEVEVADGAKGRLRVARTDVDRPRFDTADVSFLHDVAHHAALLLGAARVTEQEHKVAVRLQQALLPEVLVRHPDVQLAARYQAAGAGLDVGGDWYETFLLPDGRLGIAVGDVMGHGLEAAAVMGRMRAGLVALAAHTTSPARLLDDLDHFASGLGGPAYATACCAFLDPASGELTYSSAGHPQVLVVAGTGGVTWLDGAASWPLCVGVADQRPDASITLEPGALVLLYSDGLIERRTEALSSGTARLADAARALRDAPVEEVCDQLLLDMADGPYEDDVVVLALRYQPEDAAGSGR